MREHSRENKSVTGDSTPVATKWLLDAVGDTGRAAVESVAMIFSPKTSQKGTGFLLDTGFLITNEHVVRGCDAGELVVSSSSSTRHSVSELILDEGRDLAAMRLPLPGGLRIRDTNIDIGVQVATWGYPLGYSGPAPLLTMGYLAGFVASTPEGWSRPAVRRLVVNGAFNPGNSGGPLFVAGDDAVIGVVVSKHAPMPRSLADAIQVLATNQSGVVYQAVDAQGNTRQFVESQIVAEVLNYFRNMTQVVIGEAIAASELIAFLSENKIPWSPYNKE